jgi:hypothetical protein
MGHQIHANSALDWRLVLAAIARHGLIGRSRKTRRETMKQYIFAAAIAASMAAAPAAFAERWVAPVNGTVSAVMMQDGDVMMKIKLPATAFKAMTADMASGGKTCTIQNIYPDALNTMILVCK